MKANFDTYPKGSIRSTLLAGLTVLILALFFAYIINPKPVNHLLDVIFKENLTNTKVK